MRRLQSFFADTPYELARDLERHYQNVLFIVFKLLGFYTQAEYRTSNGRIDMVLKTDRYIYVMEFKLNGSAEEAIRQINEKGYAAPFASDVRTLYKIGGLSKNKQTREKVPDNIIVKILRRHLLYTFLLSSLILAIT